MKLLTAEITKLLDKLYNLRGEDSVILSKMDKEKSKAEETMERTASEKKELQEKIKVLSEEENALIDEGEKLVSALSKIKTKDFKTVLDKLRIDFNPDKLCEELNNNLPRTLDKVKEEIEYAKQELVTVEAEMSTAIAMIEELGIRKDEALANQARLNEYFELALDGNINITRDSITSLLEKFELTEDEQRETAKIMMFPEDALYDYEKRLKSYEQTGKSISEVFAEAKENVEDVVELKNDIENRKLSPKEELIELLKELGFDYLDFTSNDLDKVLTNYKEEYLRKNVAFANSKNINIDLFIDNVELLYDSELEEKISKLIEVGKDIFDIYLNPNILIKYDINGLTTIIDKLKSSGLDPKKVPLIAY